MKPEPLLVQLQGLTWDGTEAGVEALVDALPADWQVVWEYTHTKSRTERNNFETTRLVIRPSNEVYKATWSFWKGSTLVWREDDMTSAFTRHEIEHRGAPIAPIVPHEEPKRTGAMRRRGQ